MQRETDPSDKTRLSATVSGRVQGVGFRYSAVNQARRLGLHGYVRNQPDGSVTVVCEGARTAVESMRAWLQRGPSAARVEQVTAHESEYRGEFRGFSIDY
ncbi:MAG: acylphosphatase [Spirochaetaceae bacterium]|nr:MAG: acylphosphatase [Spirochaetaceae bacterium]